MNFAAEIKINIFSRLGEKSLDISPKIPNKNIKFILIIFSLVKFNYFLNKVSYEWKFLKSNHKITLKNTLSKKFEKVAGRKDL